MSSGVERLRAIAHPVRLRILSLLTGTELSAAEVARELGLTHANASYHLRRLLAAGQVVEAGREHIRGGVAKRYRHPWEPEHRADHAADNGADNAADNGDVDASRLFVRAIATELERRSTRRARGDDVKATTTDAELWVEPQVWQRVVDAVQEASLLLHSEARAPRTAGTAHVNMTAALFEMDDVDAHD